MKQAEAIVIAELRKAAGNTVPDAVWAVVEKQVDEVGLHDLTGTAKAIVESIVVKHGSPGDKGYASMHPTSQSGQSRTGGASSDGNKQPSVGSGGGGSSSGSFGSEGYRRTNDTTGRTIKDPAERKAISDSSRKEIADAKGNGLQPPEKGRFRGADDITLTQHGEVMSTAEIYSRGSKPTVNTQYGPQATVKGFKHRDDVAVGDVIGQRGTPGKVAAYEVVGRGQVETRRGTKVEAWEVRAIGKSGKGTGKSQMISMRDFDEGVTILAPRQRRS